MRINVFGSVMLVGLSALLGASSGSGHSALPALDLSDFVQQVENPYFPLRPGTVYFYTAQTPEGTETNQVLVTSDRKTILGVPTIVVHDRVFLNGELTEDTLDWYAPDRFGNVWYFGEDSKSIHHGVVVSTAGSWEAGKHNAMPGIVMEAHPTVGDVYLQEFQAGVAEDTARVVNLDRTLPMPAMFGLLNPLGMLGASAGHFEHVIKTREWSPLEPSAVEWKYYAPGVGFVFGVEHDGSDVIVTRLTNAFGP